jgi:hypothetical protein
MNDACPPEPFEWDGEVMRPLGRSALTPSTRSASATSWSQSASAQTQRTSTNSLGYAKHGCPFPTTLAEKFPTAEHLRKWALIRAGYSDSHTITCASKAEAIRVAAFIRPIDEFAVVVTQGSTVTRYTAKSQSRRAMGAKDFQESKTKIMEVIARMLGVEPAALPECEAA